MNSHGGKEGWLSWRSSSKLAVTKDPKPSILGPGDRRDEISENAAEEKRGQLATSLRKKHENLHALREGVNLQKEELQREHEEFGYRLCDVCSSQQELMNVFEEAFANRSLERDHEYLVSLWRSARDDTAKWQTRLSRIGQSMSLAVNPEAQLIVADSDFLDEVKKLLASLPASKTEENERMELQADAEASSLAHPSLLYRLFSRRSDVKMFTERLHELRHDHEDENMQRGLLLDRGDPPKISHARFFNRYETTRGQIEQDLRQAYADVNELEKACAEKGYDISIPVHAQERSVSSGSMKRSTPEGIVQATIVAERQRKFPEVDASRIDSWIASSLEGMLSPATEQPPRQSKRGLKMKRLRKKHTDMTILRHRVEAQKYDLQPEYEDLNFRLEDLRCSQEELIDALKEDIGRLRPHVDIDGLLKMWDKTNSDAATFNARADSIKQFENLQVQPQAELILAEEDFVKAAERAVASRGKAPKSEPQQPQDAEPQDAVGSPATFDSSSAFLDIPARPGEGITSGAYSNEGTWSALGQPLTPSHPSDQGLFDLQEIDYHEGSPTNPVLVQLQNRRTELRFYRERLNELDWDQDEDKLDRELLLDRGDEPSLPEAEFQETYLILRQGMLKDIKDAEADLAHLEEDCRAQGIDIALPRRRGSSSSRAYLSAAGDVLSEREADVAMGESAVFSQGARGSDVRADLNQHPSSESLRLTPAKAKDPALIEQWLHNPEVPAEPEVDELPTTPDYPFSENSTEDDALNLSCAVATYICGSAVDGRIVSQ